MKRYYYIITLSVLLWSCMQPDKALYLGMGTKVGEITDQTAIIHVRLSTTPGQIERLEVPGAEGWARIVFIDDIVKPSPWQECVAANDHSTQFNIGGLSPGTLYEYGVELKSITSNNPTTSGGYSFQTAPGPQDDLPVKLQITTCQDLWGVPTYDVMARQKPDFLVSTGDNVYYDKGYNSYLDTVLDGKTPKRAYQCYQRMYGSPQIVSYFRHIGGYFMKDDHDYRFNDADTTSVGRWIKKEEVMPGVSHITQENEKNAYDEAWLSHTEGLEVFKKVFPMSEKTYRTFRWGKGLQIWMVEGRDYRSPNKMPDGPEKTLWGKEQKEWLMNTLKDSDAKYKLVISPTPIVGPDRPKKIDNHANPNGFWHEGRSFLDWLIENEMDNTVLFCGDRHWQYHSTYKSTIHEFSCGPTSTRHTAGVVQPYVDEVTLQYGNSIGGFLSVQYNPDGGIDLHFHNEKGVLLYQYLINL